MKLPKELTAITNNEELAKQVAGSNGSCKDPRHGAGIEGFDSHCPKCNNRLSGIEDFRKVINNWAKLADPDGYSKKTDLNSRNDEGNRQPSSTLTS